MGKFIKGDVIVVPFPFSDLSASKRRPAVILADLPGHDYIMSQITSQGVSDNLAIALGADEIDGGTLANASHIRPNKLFTADESLVMYKIGSLQKEKLQETIKKVVDIFTA